MNTLPLVITLIPGDTYTSVGVYIVSGIGDVDGGLALVVQYTVLLDP